LKEREKLQRLAELFFEQGFVIIKLKGTFIFRVPFLRIFRVVELVSPFLRLKDKNFKKRAPLAAAVFHALSNKKKIYI
jgi:hypothetical protein